LRTPKAGSTFMSSVVDLVMIHEGAYLDHRRKYALARA
jgi:hypothetical protein